MAITIKSDFSNIETWIFDLDNTLYPRSTNLFAQIDVKMQTFIQNMLGLEGVDARALQKKFYREFGTTLRGLMTVHDIAPRDFLDYVHDIDYSIVPEDQPLRAQLSALPGRKIIFTNGTVAHAENVLKEAGLAGLFEKIYDIEWADLIPKPERVCYEKLVAEEGMDPAMAAMFEDLPRNLEVPHALGMRTVLVTDDEVSEESGRQSWEVANQDAPYIHHRTQNLAEFLQACIG